MKHDYELIAELERSIEEKLARAAARTAALKRKKAVALSEAFNVQEIANQARALKFEMNGYGVSMSFAEAVHAVSSKEQE